MRKAATFVVIGALRVNIGSLMDSTGSIKKNTLDGPNEILTLE